MADLDGHTVKPGSSFPTERGASNSGWRSLLHLGAGTDLVKAQQRSLRGSGECLLKIDPKTGEVTDVAFLVSPPSSLLKHSVALGFLKWRFRPGKVTHVTIAFEYHRSGFVCRYQG